MFLFVQVELASFPGIWTCPSPGLLQGWAATDSAGALSPHWADGGREWRLMVHGSWKRVTENNWCFRQESSWHPVLFYGF